MSAIRQRFWVVNGRVSVKQIGKRCMVCKQRKARANEPFMSTLLSFRVAQGNPPFCRSGVAVHIELAESLDTDSFINAMQRFIN